MKAFMWLSARWWTIWADSPFLVERIELFGLQADDRGTEPRSVRLLDER